MIDEFSPDLSQAQLDEANCKFKQQLEPKNQLSVDSQEEEKIFYSAYFEGLVDIVLDDQDEVAFLVKGNGVPSLKYEHLADEKKYVPPPKNKIKWLLPKASAVLDYYTNDNDTRLFDDLVSYHQAISELPSEDYYKFLASFDMSTYLSEQFEYSPIIWFYATPERGKTRTGKGIIYVSFRGVHFITLRESHILRMAEDARASLFLDISDLWNKAASAGVEDILLNRYEKGATVARIHYPEKGPFNDTVYYQIYGPTVVATNETVNEILSSRTIQIVMPQSSNIYEADVKPIDGLPFRERLVAFRARWIDRSLPIVDKPCAGRLGDILRPIRQIINIAHNEGNWFLGFTYEVEKKRKLTGIDSLDAQVVGAIKESMKTIKQGHLLNEDILAQFNRSKSERERISPHKLGKITSRLGFEKYSSGQQRGIYFNEKLFMQLCERYGIESGIIMTDKPPLSSGTFANCEDSI